MVFVLYLLVLKKTFLMQISSDIISDKLSLVFIIGGVGLVCAGVSGTQLKNLDHSLVISMVGYLVF